MDYFVHFEYLMTLCVLFSLHGTDLSLTISFFFFFLVHRSLGCSYKGRKYSHTEEVYTSQPCLNCTCQRGFVSCFLRVCPVLDPPENDDTCYLLKEPGNCCSTLKCSGLHDPSSPEQPEAASLESHSTTSTSPGYKNFGWNGGNGIERKAETVYRRTTSVRPPYNDYWGASRRISSTKAPQTSKPYARATSRPTLRSPATAKPLSHNRNFPLKPTFPPRRPMYPPAPSSNGPTNNYNRRPSTTGSTSTRKPSTTLSTNRRTPVSSITSSLNAHKDTPVREDPAINENDSDNFFRMSHLLVWLFSHFLSSWFKITQ